MTKTGVYDAIRKLFPTVLDPVQIPLARVYADALYQAASKKGELEQVREELRGLIHDLFQRNPDFEKLLLAPAISPNRKAEIIRRAFGDGRASETFVNFLLVLNRRHRLSLLRTIAEEFAKLYDERQGIRDVHVELAFEPTEEVKKLIEAELARILGGKPRVHYIVAPEIIGGIIIRLDYRILDGSIRTQLERLKRRIRERSRYEIQSRRDQLHS